jgi:hypothetical protein
MQAFPPGADARLRERPTIVSDEEKRGEDEATTITALRIGGRF